MVIVIADYRARQGAGDVVAEVLARHVAATRREPGCEEFVAHRDVEDGDHFALYERYSSQSAFRAHRQTEHFKSNIEGRIVPLLTQRTWHVFDEVPPSEEQT